MVAAAALSLAAAEAIAAAVPQSAQNALVTHGGRLAKAATALAAEDRNGTWWTPGLVAACEALADNDSRYLFCRRFARSAFFGDLMAKSVERAIAGSDVHSSTQVVARLINIFITAFDGLCDEVPEHLPTLLPALTRLFANFPAIPSDRPTGNHPVVWLSFESARSATELLEPALAKSREEFASAFVATVRDAFSTQLASMRSMPAGQEKDGVQDRRARISRAAFRVAVLIPAAFHARAQEDLSRLRAAADALGDHFGWIDDLVDLDDDVLAGRENMVGTQLTAAGFERSYGGGYNVEADRLVHEDAAERWANLMHTLDNLGLLSTEMEETLGVASLAWLTGTSGATPIAICE